MRFAIDRRRLLHGAALPLAMAAFACATSAAHADCLRAEIPGALVLPDGSIHTAATISLCRIQALSPAADLVEARVDNASVGMFIGRRQGGESPGENGSAFYFYRTGVSELELFGWVQADGSATQVFRIESIGKIKKRVVTRELFSEDSRRPVSPPIVLVAATLD